MAKKEFPTRTEIRKARKAGLQAWCRDFGLDDGGTVPELRERLLDHREGLEEEVELEEEGEEVLEEVYVVKEKATLDPRTVELLNLRRQLQSQRPQFRRQEWFRYRRLGDKWRRPRGRHSKLRRRLGYRPAVPSSGRGGPRTVRGLHPTGFEEVRVHRPEEVEGLDPKTQAVRIGHTVGTRKRLAIQERADEAGVRVLNRVVE